MANHAVAAATGRSNTRGALLTQALSDEGRFQEYSGNMTVDIKKWQ